MTELYIGSHLSTAGGWNALLERSHEEGGTAFAFFPRSPYGKRSKALDPAGAAAFGARLKAEGYGPLVVHAPYVYNLAGKEEFTAFIRANMRPQPEEYATIREVNANVIQEDDEKQEVLDLGKNECAASAYAAQQQAQGAQA